MVIGLYNPINQIGATQHSFTEHKQKRGIMKLTKPFLILIAGLMIASACTSTPEIDVDATIAAGLAATQTAMPTNTPVPTNTPEPTHTPVPTNTPEPTPTEVLPTEVPPTEAPEVNESEVDSGLATNPAGTFVITTLNDGSRLFEVPASGFSIIFPEDYEAVDPADNEMLQAALDSTLSESGLSSSQLAALAGAGIKLYAVNTSTESLTSASPLVINIIEQELPISFTVEEFTEVNQTQIGSFLDLTSEVAVDYLQLGDVPASYIAYTANIPTPLGSTVEFANTQYLIIDPDNDKKAYIVTVGMPLEVVGALGPDALAVAESFRLLGGE